MYTSFLRTIIFYLFLIVFLRLMGKRQIGELQPSELAVTLLIADLASIPMQATDIPLLTGLIPIATLLVLEIGLSYLSLKSRTMRKLISGSSTVLVEDGKINQRALKKLRFNLDDLMEELRLKDIANVSDVEFAILETNGKLSVFPKPEKRPLTPEDVQLTVSDSGIPLMLISDGIVDYVNLQKANHTVPWLKRQLKRYHILDFSKVFLMSIDSKDTIHLEIKEKAGGNG